MIRVFHPNRKKVNRGRKGWKRGLAVWLAAALVCTGIPAGEVKAASKSLSLSQAKSLGLTNSDDYMAVENKLALAEMRYAQSVKSLKLKEKNQKTFRWSPLLSFKFPERPDLSDQFEYIYKPLELQAEIDSIKHELKSIVFTIYEEISLEFSKIYTLQETIAFTQTRIETCEETLHKNKSRLVLGQANQSDVDAMEKKLARLEESLASDMRSLEAEKEKLSNLIGLDVSANDTFRNPYVKAEIGRDRLDSIIQYTLENDHSYYQAKRDTSNALLALDTNYNLMKSEYGSKVNIISSFINQAKRGEKLKSAAFRRKYDEFLTEIDKPWQGKKRILFIWIPKEWFKGELDGIRYVEDEPYVLYEAALEYQNLYAEQQSMEKDLTAQVKEGFENYISTRNSYQSIEKQVADKENELKKAGVLNSLGEMTYEEYAAVQEELEELQMDLIESLAAYSDTLYSFDRLTCGAISSLLKGEDIEVSASSGGESYIVEEQEEGVYYYIHSLVEGNLFELGLSIPQDFDVSITEYELWVNGQQIGERTEAGKSIRHLALGLDQVERAFIRLYGDGAFIDDCDFDPSVYSGKLTITTGYAIEREEDDLIGSYTAETNTTTGILELTIRPEPGEEIGFYQIKTADGSYLLGEELIAIEKPFRYLQAAGNSLEELIVVCYDKEKALLYEGVFKKSDQTIHKKEGGT